MERFEYSPSDYILKGPKWEEREDITLSKFDILLRNKWDKIMEAGHFRYSMNDVKARIVPGKEHFYTQLNLKRGTQRRTPESINSVNMPFDPKKFNFTKAKQEEILFELCPQEESSAWPADDGRAVNVEGLQMNGVSVEENDAPPRHLMLVNVSPLEYGHSLVVPDAYDHIYQNLEPVCPGLYEMTGKPTRALVLQLHGHTVHALARMAFVITDFCQKNDIAHNVFLTRGDIIGDGSEELGRTVRIYIWPRKTVIGQKNESGAAIFNIAVAELAGHVPVYVAERFEDLTEQEIITYIQKDLLPDDEFNRIRNKVSRIIEKLVL